MYGDILLSAFLEWPSSCTL